MDVPFTKAHGAQNDFLLTMRKELPKGAVTEVFPSLARLICHRYTGIGADGWMIIDTDPEFAIELYNSDGSKPELSGNGTRCAAAYLVRGGYAIDKVTIRTGAGLKQLHLLTLRGPEFQIEMNMGSPLVKALSFPLTLSTGIRDVTLVDVGNPQCAVPVADFDFEWRAMGREIEFHSQFPNRTNVSFIRAVDEHAIDVRFYERGAGETMSSGTGSTGAAAAAIARGLVTPPVLVLTPAGPLHVRVDTSFHVTGPAEIVAEGVFHCGTIA